MTKPKLPTDPRALRKLAALGQWALDAHEAGREQDKASAERMAQRQEEQRQRDNPPPAVVIAVRNQVADIQSLLVAIHGTAYRAEAGSGDEPAQALAVIRAAVRSAAVILDTCQQRLGGVPIGDFADDMGDA